MKKTTIGAILLVIIGGLLVLTYSWIRPILFEKNQRNTSDASGKLGSLTIGGDNYLGYWFLTAPEMRKACARDGLQIQFEDDGGAYVDRLKAFADRKLDAVVMPISSYLIHGEAHKYPGVIVAAISESRGADGLVSKNNITQISQLNDPNLKIVYTADSPSSFLLDLTIADFDLTQLAEDPRWRVEVGGSRDVLKKAEKGEGDVFVMWEPDLSKAKKLPGIHDLWGSDRFSGYIIDVLIVHRDVVQNRKEAVATLLKHYFRTLKVYANNREKMLDEMGRSTDLKKSLLDETVKKIEWYDLFENARLQFGLPGKTGETVNDGLISAILANTDVLVRTKRLSKDPLAGNPYLITQSSFLEHLQGLEVTDPVKASNANISFDPLSDEEWNQMRQVGVFRVEPITFQSWNNLLTQDGKDTVDRIATLLRNNYPQYRILVRGHTAPGGDENENRKLSLERAQSVVQYLKAVHELDPHRMHAVGAGSAIPPERKPGESQRAYLYRQARVEFVALEGNNI
ncbi:MAG: OmpA family protein [Acidobacteria bacterium]|nr:OmpA family protein [Acidobacteriota bacterium]MCB9397737.1 OmpA family protein [Acidobacteriota bacterium]